MDGHEQLTTGNISPGKGHYRIGTISWVLLGIAIVFQAGLLLFGVGGEVTQAILKALVVNSATIIIVPLVISYLLWILTGESRRVSVIAFNLVLFLTAGWVTTQQLSVTKNLGPILTYSKTQLSLRKELLDAAGDTNALASVMSQIHSAKMDLLDSLAASSSGPVQDFYATIRQIIDDHEISHTEFESFRDQVFQESFVDYRILKNQADYQSRSQSVQAMVKSASILAQISERTQSAITSLQSSSQKLGPVETRLIEEELKGTFSSLERMRPFYLSCVNFGNAVQALLNWLYSNPQAWEYTESEQKMTVNSPEAHQKFSQLVADAESGAKALNTAADRANAEENPNPNPTSIDK